MENDEKEKVDRFINTFLSERSRQQKIDSLPPSHSSWEIFVNSGCCCRLYQLICGRRKGPTVSRHFLKDFNKNILCVYRADGERERQLFLQLLIRPRSSGRLQGPRPSAPKRDIFIRAGPHQHFWIKLVLLCWLCHFFSGRPPIGWNIRFTFFCQKILESDWVVHWNSMRVDCQCQQLPWRRHLRPISCCLAFAFIPISFDSRSCQSASRLTFVTGVHHKTRCALLSDAIISSTGRRIKSSMSPESDGNSATRHTATAHFGWRWRICPTGTTHKLNLFSADKHVKGLNAAHCVGVSSKTGPAHWPKSDRIIPNISPMSDDCWPALHICMAATWVFFPSLHAATCFMNNSWRQSAEFQKISTNVQVVLINLRLNASS